MGHLSSKEGQIIHSAAVDDVLAIILLAVVASLAKLARWTSRLSDHQRQCFPAWCNFTGTFLQQIFVAIAINSRAVNW